MLEFHPSKNGQLSAFSGGIHIHSGINPAKEAEKYFLSKVDISKNTPGLLLLLFPGLNYLYPVIKKYLPAAKIVVVHINHDFFKHSPLSSSDALANAGDCVWFPECGIKLKQFLYSSINETEAKNILTLTWEPVIRAFPSEAKKISAIVEQVLTEYNSNISTTLFFGKKSIKNAIRNILNLESIAFIEPINKPVIITGSGPTLEKSISLIKEKRKSVFLLALSSSCSILEYNGIKPDIVLTTDSGYYAALHLDYSINSEQVISAPITANRGRFCGNPLLLLNQGSFVENHFLRHMQLPFLRINPNGTVAGSAVFLTSLLTDRPVILTGIDFCTHDIKTHCSPHAFENIFFCRSTRTTPLLDHFYSHVTVDYPNLATHDRISRTSKQLSAYSGWFSSTTFKGNYYRLNPSGVNIDGISTLNSTEAKTLIDSTAPSSDMQFRIYKTNKPEQLKLIRNALDILSNDLESRLSDTSTESCLKSIISNYHSDILYYFDTVSYMHLIEYAEKKDDKSFSENLAELLTNCRYFISRESLKISGDSFE